jgi:hypothetical protein
VVAVVFFKQFSACAHSTRAVVVRSHANIQLSPRHVAKNVGIAGQIGNRPCTAGMSAYKDADRFRGRRLQSSLTRLASE